MMKMDVSASSLVGHEGDLIVVVAKLTNDGGQPIARNKIVFYVEGDEEKYYGETDAFGNAYCIVELDDSVGIFQIMATAV
jgi:hypothetical protein